MQRKWIWEPEFGDSFTRSQSKFPFSHPRCINPFSFTWALNNAWYPPHPHPKAFHYINLLQVGHHSTLVASITARGKACGPWCITGGAAPSEYDCTCFKAQMGFSKHLQVDLTQENTLPSGWEVDFIRENHLHRRNLKPSLTELAS